VRAPLGLACALALLGTAASAQALKDLKPQAPLTLAAQGSFFVGGRTVHTEARTGLTPSSGDRYAPYPAGDWTVDQMYVQFETPVNAKRHVPVVMVHGCCLSSKTWETTPDGRMGWYEYFVRRGRATYLAEQVGRGRSGFDATPYNAAKLGQASVEAMPTINMFTAQLGWSVFRIGPNYPEVFPDQQFPMEFIGEMQKQVIPDLIAAVGNPNPTLANMAALAGQLGGAVLMGHSQSGFYPELAALNDPKGVRGMISLEPGGCNAATLKDADYALLAKIPTIVVYGDHLGDVPLRDWKGSAKDCEAYVAKIRSLGGDATYLELPSIGMHGNGHMFMQDRNSLEIADLMLKWIDDHVERARR
jgi:pimeloyl-ACP methyl ester carboxylesterase